MNENIENEDVDFGQFVQKKEKNSKKSQVKFPTKTKK